ncbi:MAG TPA: hypothetical protein VLE99_05360 [Candidatus Saccharimonadales bacterium]|nr:hypothetical protein [Candidatus Saccharimonadales bacterium]
MLDALGRRVNNRTLVDPRMFGPLLALGTTLAILGAFNPVFLGAYAAIGAILAFYYFKSDKTEPYLHEIPMIAYMVGWLLFLPIERAYRLRRYQLNME